MNLAHMEQLATDLRGPAPVLSDVAELARREQRGWKPRMAELRREGEPMSADGIYYVDTRAPHVMADFGQITLSTTSLMLWPGSWAGSNTPAGYWDVGKKWHIVVFGKFTTGITPGNLTAEIRFGTTDNAGTILATSAATALAASKTNVPWIMKVFVHARSTPSATSGLFAWGWIQTDQAGGLLTSALQPLFIPASAPAAVNVDTTAASGINIQFKRSGSTGETVTVQDLTIQAVN